MCAMHYWCNKSEKTTVIYQKLIKRFFPELKMLNLLISFRDKEKKDDEGNVVVAEAKRVAVRERDLWGPDIEICADHEIWEKSNIADKYRIAFHELCHFSIDKDDETGEVKLDDNNRVKVSLVKHDIVIKTFKREVEIFGLDGNDHELAVFMQEVLENPKTTKKNKSEFLAKLGIGSVATESNPDLDTMLVAGDSKKKKKIAHKSSEAEMSTEPIIKKKKKKVEEKPTKVVKKKNKYEDDDDED